MVAIGTNVTILAVVSFIILFLLIINLIVNGMILHVLIENRERKRELFAQRLRTQILLRENLRNENPEV